ncbi:MULTISPECIES: transglutaminase-like domain-containing protein [unclassified Frankia]|uniref:transglutaminase-like domain-containing protein n=1 Tax=unclassified Frankia TaxID=2632575 RepID=UPI002AD1DD58|nr:MULTISPECIES: transglutaminase-like domain-containing protein [unclassified Frankia]
MSARTRRQFADIVRQDPIDVGLACMLIAAEVEPEIDPGRELGRFDLLAADAGSLLGITPSEVGATGDRPAGDRPAVGPTVGPTVGPVARRTLAGLDVRTAAEILRETLGTRAGFHGDAGDFDSLHASLLTSVLRRRHGLPILLSIVWTEVAHRLGVPAYPIGLPGHVIVGVGSPERQVLVDPFAGGRMITVHEAAEKVRSAGVAFTRSHLEPMNATDLLMRVLGNIRVWAARSEAVATRLWAVELSLLLPHHPTHLLRERGELRARLGDFRGGADDLATFADAVASPEPAAAAAAREAARAARARLN